MSERSQRILLASILALTLPIGSAAAADPDPSSRKALLRTDWPSDPLAVEIRATESSSALRMFSDESIQAAVAAVLADDQLPATDGDRRLPSSSRPYWVVAAFLTAATVYDVESTFHLSSRCEECREANPVARPFIERGRLATYAYSAAVNGIILYVARWMYHRSDPWWRVFPVAVSIVHGIAGTWNFVRASQPPD